MKINNDTLRLREIAGETIVVNQGAVDIDMTKIISLNTSAKYLFETFQGKEFTADDVANTLVEHYGISQELADVDAAAWVKALKQCALISE